MLHTSAGPIKVNCWLIAHRLGRFVGDKLEIFCKVKSRETSPTESDLQYKERVEEYVRRRASNTRVLQDIVCKSRELSSLQVLK